MKVRLSASRQPYMRAGIAIGARGAFTVLSRGDISPEQWLKLLSDPVVQIAISDDDGETWTSPSDDERESAIASVATAVTPVPTSEQKQPVNFDLGTAEIVFVRAGVSSLAELDVRLDQLLRIEADSRAAQQLIADQGFQSLDDLIVAWADDRGRLQALAEEVEQSKAGRQGDASAGETAPAAGDGEGQGAAAVDQGAASAAEPEKSEFAGKAHKAARKGSATSEAK